MIIAIHRVNTVAALKQISAKYGVEVDVRGYGKHLVLHYEPLQRGEDFETFLRAFNHRFIIFNIKEAGIEDLVHTQARLHNIKGYFLLDVEFPYVYRAARAGEKRIAMRYSEDEVITTALKYKGKVDWVWIDTQTRLPLNKKVIQSLRGFKTALVSPERWGRHQDISRYVTHMKKLRFKPDLVMTEKRFANIWEDAF